MRRGSAAWILLRRDTTPFVHRSQHLSLQPAAAAAGPASMPRCIETQAVMKDDGGDQKRIVEKRWHKLFSDPSQWWDHRAEKGNARYPDFKHKKTWEGLWLNDNLNPPWVEAELAAMAPGTVQLSIFSWNSRLARYEKAGQYENTLRLFQQMKLEGMSPDKFTFVRVLNACANLPALEEGRSIHMQIIQSGCDLDIYVCNSLIDMYAKCGSLEDAWSVFNMMPSHDVVTWNSLILGHVRCGQGLKALALFQQMQQEGMEPDPVTFVGVVNACASIAALEDGKRVHEQIIQRGFESIMFVGNSLVDMYAKCGSIEDSLRVFNRMSTRNVVAWSAIILGHVKCGQGHKALELSSQMQQEGVEPNAVTFVGILNACASIEALKEGKDVHEQIIQSGWESNVSVGSSLVDMYAKCGSIDEAWRVFNSMPKRDVVAWNAMIMGYAKCGQGQKALQLSCQMQHEGVHPVPVTFVGMLNACASVAALEEGRHIHEAIIQSGYELDVFVGSSLIDMYAKCGSVEDAWRVFNRMPRRNMVAWTAMLGAYAMHGHANEALAHFKRMCEQGVEIDDITFLSLLSACRHAGLVDEGLCYFESMNSVYGVSPTNEHYACVVDLLGRAGHLHDAEVLIKTMPFEPNATVWMALLGACRIHGNLEMGECIARRVLELDPGNSAGYVLLSNIYAAAGNWDLSATVQKLRLERGVRRQQGRTWIEVNNEVHTFVVDDQEHPQINEIHAELKRLSVQMKDAGYVPDLTFMLHDVEEEEKLFHLCHHSEKLAIAYGLISTPPGTPIRIFKNLHVCGDCHSAAKFIAKLVGRAIIIRDANQFHHFENGLCSCKDYW